MMIRSQMWFNVGQITTSGLRLWKHAYATRDRVRWSPCDLLADTL